MKVKIIQCSSPDYWYHSMLSKGFNSDILDVVEWNETQYCIQFPTTDKGVLYLVDKKDCQILDITESIPVDSHRFRSQPESILDLNL